MIRKWALLLMWLFVINELYAQQNDSDKAENWSYHFQLTAIEQGHTAFAAKYSGQNSLVNNREDPRLSLTTTLFVGRKLWNGASFYFNPEIAGGEGLSLTRGIAGFPNGETFRIGNPAPALFVARAYLQQVFRLSDDGYEYLPADANQLGQRVPRSRITLTAGKFSIADFFDDNKFSHDPRTQFMNWALMSNGAWDYPANTRGYTSGVVLELNKPFWAIRLAAALVPKTANGSKMDGNISKAHSFTAEYEKRWMINQFSGAFRLLGFYNVSLAPDYNFTIESTKNGDSSLIPVVTGDKEGKIYDGVKYGFGYSADQEISNSVGVFSRFSWNDGRTATWAFTEIDQSFSLGLNLKGGKWKRPNDNIAAAFLVNGISAAHRAYLDKGLYGFMIGDGKLTNYGSENIFEIYYNAQVTNTISAALDYQFVKNPAYNKDRGPVNVFAARLHIGF